MKPSLKRSMLFEEGKTILRSQVFYTGNGMFWHIVQYNGKGWSRWPLTQLHKTQEQAENAIDTQCSIDPLFMNDANIQTL